MPTTPEEALRSILRGSGTAYDPEIVAAFDRIMRRRIADGEANGDGHGVDQGLDIDEIINGAFNGASLLEIEPGRSTSPGPPETEEE
jgi:hypothetical protein